MELLQLKYFCDAARSENFSKTAAKYSVPPSNISQSIKRLEKELSVTLFIRHANKVILNAAGREFYDKISCALDLIQSAASCVDKNSALCKINICVNTNRRIVMNTVEKFRKAYPDIEIVTEFFSDPLSDEFDLIISGKDESLLGYAKNLLLQEQLAFNVSSDSPIVTGYSIDFSALSREPFITMSDKNNLYDITYKVCSSYGFTPRIAVQSDDPYYVRKCVEMGLGVAVVPTFSWKGQFSSKTLLVPIENFTRESYVYSKKVLPEATRLFLNALMDECRNDNN